MRVHATQSPAGINNRRQTTGRSVGASQGAELKEPDKKERIPFLWISKQANLTRGSGDRAAVTRWRRGGERLVTGGVWGLGAWGLDRCWTSMQDPAEASTLGPHCSAREGVVNAGMEDSTLEKADLLFLLFPPGQQPPAPQASAPGL